MTIQKRKGGGCTNQGADRRGRIAYRDEKHRLYKSRGGQRTGIGNNTERKSRGYTNPGVAEGAGSLTIQKVEAEEGGEERRRSRGE